MTRNAALQTLKSASRPQSIKLDLRSGRVDYLKRIAERDMVSSSQVFRAILRKYASFATSPFRRPAKKQRSHIVIAADDLAILDRLALEGGVQRSEIARRLIDQAEQDDPIIFG